MTSAYTPDLPPETAPPVVLWARIYAGALALVYLLVAALGVFVLVMGVAVAPGTKDALPATLMGIIYLLLGIAFAIPTTWGAFAGRKKYVWYLHLGLICLGFTSCACLPVCIPLIIYWLKPETKAWYGA